MKKKETRGGKRKGAGRKTGKKAYVTTIPRPTKVLRVPIPLVDHVEEMIENYYESVTASQSKQL